MTFNKNELKMSLQELRSTIDIKKNKWFNQYTTNCYAYALGLDISEEDILKYAFIPGRISGLDLKPIFTYSELIENLYSDLEFLGIDYREVNSEDSINENEWKIAVFIQLYNHDDLIDFHFLRFCSDGKWYHKNGWSSNPTIYDSNGNIIYNPENCYLEEKIYKMCLRLKLN